MPPPKDEVCKVKTKIIYEDQDVLVIQKPPGLATQTSKVGQQDVVSELKNYLAVKASAGFHTDTSKGCSTGLCTGTSKKRSTGLYTDTSKERLNVEPYLGIIHRLDQPVEGLLVFAKNKNAAAALTAQLHKEKRADAAKWRGERAYLTDQLRGEKDGGAGTLNKIYYGVFCGKAPGNSGELIDYLYKDPSGKAMIWEESEGEKPPQVKRAVLQYHILQTERVQDIRLSLAKIHIVTGRYHQIRAQMSHAGMSLLGDVKYVDAAAKAASERLNIRNVALCAFYLEFCHPITKEKLSFQMKPQGEVFSFFSIK